MTLVDSSILIDYFRGVVSPEADKLDKLLGTEVLLTGESDYGGDVAGILGRVRFQCGSAVDDNAPECSVTRRSRKRRSGCTNCRSLRAQGVPIRKIIDTFTTTYCIENAVPLLFSDRDFSHSSITLAFDQPSSTADHDRCVARSANG
ncbi:VapC toxin family PIN domain ribonuclease [Paraburkholderia sp. ZP32-5]|uniref:VapC toxin family PIN domain ribonuclease n=1 Tax=Paraburkholderia sp. ZP32-5 TaxID=2883245 RepID=UPI001F2D8529|nr:VapC toxin family PIN domain ribonuclease [Paraburkholderia sp. ZP32-5]